MSILGKFPVGSQPLSSGRGPTESGIITDFLVDSLDVSETILSDTYNLAVSIESMTAADVVSVQKITGRALTEALTMDEALDAQTIAVLVDTILYSESFVFAWEALSELKESIEIGEILSIFLSDQLAENIDVSDLWSHYGLILGLKDFIRVTGLVDTTLEANEVLAEALTFLDIVKYVMGADLAELINVSELFELNLIAVNNQLDAMQIADALDYSVTITAFLDENMQVDGQLTSVAELLRLLEDSMSVGVKLTNDTGVYEAWAMNTMTGGATLYDNFPFNSFALHTNKKYLGAAGDGIYELSGADDDGTPIDAGFKTGLMDFGSTLSKRMVDAWFTMTSEGEMLLKTTTVEADGKVERWYKVKKTPRMHRAKMARGVKAMFWQFELTNLEGRDFDLDNLALHPLPLNRRY